MKANRRKVAAHEVHIDQEVMKQAVVELENDEVVACYPFQDELPMTEWLGGTIVVRRDENGRLRAYWNETLLYNKV